MRFLSRVSLCFAAMFNIQCQSLTKSERKKLDDIIARYTESMKRADAYDAPYFNVEEDLSRFGDYLSPEYFLRMQEIRKTAITSLNTIEKSKLNDKDALLYRLFKEDVELGLEYFEYSFHFIDSFTQMGNRFRSYIDDSSPSLTSFPFDSVKHYYDFIERSAGFLPFVDRQIATLREGLAKGYSLNCTVAKSAIRTYQEALNKDIEKNPFYRPALNLPKSFSEKDRNEIQLAFQNMIRERILPGFEKFDHFYRETYLPACRSSYGIGELPEGSAMYDYKIRVHTDLKLQAATLHQTGLNEVSRIAGEMEKIKNEMGFKGSLQKFLRSLVEDEKYYFKSPTALFGAFQNYRKVVDQVIPKYFSLTPKSDFKLVESENPEDAAASYRMPTDYQPFGRFVVNTQNLKGVPTYGVQTLYLHEAIPGHHFQLALQYEMKNELSEYQRKIYGSTAFVEGWALYSERLGSEEGWLSDSLQKMGSLSDEMLRAVRLVVDTGIHSFGWSREKTIQYMKKYLASDIRDIEIEADRYSVWPGQALAYKTGQLKIIELREYAKSKLGPKFDIREFHGMVLQNGTVSLGVLDSVVKNWVKVKGKGSTASL